MENPEKDKKTARKGLPGSKAPASQKSPATESSNAKAAKHQSNPTFTGKRKRADISKPSNEAKNQEPSDNTSGLKAGASSTVPAKKRKKTANTDDSKDVGEGNSKSKKSSKTEDDDNSSTEDRPAYKSTQKPVGTKLCESPRGVCWKISGDVSVETSRVLHQGTIAEYNLSQMNHHWIKILVKNLKDVAQIKCSVRGWKETLPYSLGVANVPDQGDLELEKKIAEVQRQLKKGAKSETDADNELQQLEAGLGSWTPGWYCEPLYEMKIIRNMFEDNQIIIVQLSSTHGELFIRTGRNSKSWREFIDWLTVKQANMHGYSSRRNNTEWNGFEVTKMPVSSDLSIITRVAEMERLFVQHQCVAIWKTKPQFMGVEY